MADISLKSRGSAGPLESPKTPAQRQAAHKARRLSDGLVHWKRWVHPDDVPHLVALADKLARKRAKASP
jgi:hypothetical protein